MELGEIGPEAVVIIAVEAKVIIDPGTELITIIKEDYINVETPEKIAGETTQEVLNIRIIFRIL
jgi:hypothetical protein